MIDFRYPDGAIASVHRTFDQTLEQVEWLYMYRHTDGGWTCATVATAGEAMATCHAIQAFHNRTNKGASK